MVELEALGKGGLAVRLAGRPILHHTSESPAIALASGDPDVVMVRGNFRLADRPAPAPKAIPAARW